MYINTAHRFTGVPTFVEELRVMKTGHCVMAEKLLKATIRVIYKTIC